MVSDNVHVESSYLEQNSLANIERKYNSNIVSTMEHL